MIDDPHALPDDDLIDAFETGQIEGADFPHERHVRVAWGLARRYGREEGLRRMVTGIRDMAARAGHPEKYHHTITRAWFELVASTRSLDKGSVLFDRTLLSRYYTPGRLSEGRDRWLAPDLQPLRLPVAGKASPVPGAPGQCDTADSEIAVSGDPAAQPLVLLLQRATHVTLDALSGRLAGLRLTPGEINVLANLVEREELRVSELSRQVGTPLTTMTSMLDRLERKGLIARRIPEANRRTVMISLTAGGRGIAAEARRAVGELEDELTAGLSARQVASLRQTLELFGQTR